MWTDSHCHVPWEGVGEEVLEEARSLGVDRFVTVGTTVGTSRSAIALAERHADVWATAGVHPHDADGADLAALEALLGAPRVVAVGECGLDYHYDHSPRGVQRDVFAAQVELARRHDLALVIHTREAWDDTFALLDEIGTPERTVFHCFTGGPVEAGLALDHGGVLSFSGIVSFKSADDVRAAAALCPLDRMTVETDSPYLAPVPHRGKPNRPGWLPDVGAALAVAKGRSSTEVAEATTATAARLFRLA
ncbi:MAG TPA: TatD family hydrolase [Acidimicrobiales bacterium]